MICSPRTRAWRFALTGVIPVLSVVTRPTPIRAQDESPPAAQAATLLAAAALVALDAFDIATAANSVRRTEPRASIQPAIDVVHQRVGIAMSLPIGGRPAARPFRYRPPAPGPPQAPGLKSPASATGWSLAATLIPAALGAAVIAAGEGNDNQTTAWLGGAAIAGGLIVGPSAGHWYAGRSGRGWATVGLRFGVVLIGAAGFSEVLVD